MEIFLSGCVPPSCHVGIDPKSKSLFFVSIFAKKLPFLLWSFWISQPFSISVNFTVFYFGVSSFSAFLPLKALSAYRKPACDSPSSYTPSFSWSMPIFELSSPSGFFFGCQSIGYCFGFCSCYLVGSGSSSYWWLVTGLLLPPSWYYMPPSPLSARMSLIFFIIFSLWPNGTPICSTWLSYSSRMVSRSSTPLSMSFSKYLSSFID